MSEKEGPKALNGEEKIPSVHLQRRKLSCIQRTLLFIQVYWRSLTVVLVPILLLPLIICYDSPVRQNMLNSCNTSVLATIEFVLNTGIPMHVRCVADDVLLGNRGTSTADYLHDPVSAVSSSRHSRETK